jgi:phosphoglycolate phosphatase-like HAD superfamily hydrolase
VRIHGNEIVEVIAPVCLREALNLKDGDEVAMLLGNRSPRGREGFAGPDIRLRGRSEGCTFPLKAIIFDLDGTLIDTIPAYFRIVDVVAERLQMPPVARETVVEAANDGSFEWAEILHVTAEGEREALNARAMAIVQEVAPFLFEEKVGLFAGVDGLLKSIAERGARMGIATSTPRRHLGRKVLALRRAGIEGLFHTVIAADDVPRTKPAPDPLLACAAKMGVQAKDCLYVGDMRTDIRAGRAAGMTTVGVLTGFDDQRSLESANPDLIVESVAALEQRLIFP